MWIAIGRASIHRDHCSLRHYRLADGVVKTAFLKVRGAVRIYIRAAGITPLSLDLRDASISVIHEGKPEANIGFKVHAMSPTGCEYGNNE
jgi:hypothetical protein